MVRMNMDELWSEVGRRVREAYAFGPASYGVLPQEYESGDWRQVVYWMQSQRRRSKGDPSADFLRELSEAKRSLAAYDCEGIRSVLDGLNAWEKRVIGECLRRRLRAILQKGSLLLGSGRCFMGFEFRDRLWHDRRRGRPRIRSLAGC